LEQTEFLTALHRRVEEKDRYHIMRFTWALFSAWQNVVDGKKCAHVKMVGINLYAASDNRQYSSFHICPHCGKTKG